VRLYASLAYFFIRLLRGFVIPAKLVPYLIRERESRTYKIVILSEAKNLGEEWAKGSVPLPPAPIVIPAKLVPYLIRERKSRRSCPSLEGPIKLGMTYW
jgi:hypothetical protein